MRRAMITGTLAVSCGIMTVTACTASDTDVVSSQPPGVESASIPATVPAENGWRTVQVGGAEGVITTGTQLGWDTIVGGDEWEPTNADLTAFENALPAALASNGLDSVAVRLAEYTRWYSALTVGGDPVLLVWFSCVASPSDGLDRIPFVDDGGECFFSASYDPADGSIKRIRVNGEA